MTNGVQEPFKNEVNPKNHKSRKPKLNEMKVTVLYGHPTDPEAFDKYYKETHLPIASRMQAVTKFEVTRFLPGPDGTAPAHYLMGELYFASPEEMQQTFGSPEGKAAVDDLANFATGGVTMLIGTVEN